MARLRRHAVLIVSSCLLVCAALPGCARPSNSRIVLGGGFTLPTFSAQTSPGPAAKSDSAPSLPRTGWNAVVFLVPVDGTVHGPTYGRRLSITGETARQNGLFPTAQTALELGGPTRSAQRREAVFGIVGATAQLAAMPVRIFLRPIWSDHQSPKRLYKRSKPGRWSSGGLIPPPPQGTAP